MSAAIVTGATSGIGRALALELASRGWDLGLSARRAGVLAAVADEIRARHAGRRVEVQVVDVRDADAVRTAVRAFFTAFGRVGLVIANAGIGGTHRVGTGEFARSRDVIATNLI